MGKFRIPAEKDSYPRSPWGERPARTPALPESKPYFNPRSPWGERPASPAKPPATHYFNPRSPWGERLGQRLRFLALTNFNPRSPWGERHGLAFKMSEAMLISIHAPRGGSDRFRVSACSALMPFQSTLPVGGATSAHNPQSSVKGISIHAPRGGSDCHGSGRIKKPKHFNPRSPWGERQGCSMLLLP